MKKAILFWVIAFVITALAGHYQRITGPTINVKKDVEVAGEIFNLEFIRNHTGEGDAELVFPIQNAEIGGTVVFRKYPTDDAWQTQPLTRDGENLRGYLPHQPKAGKVAYYVNFTSGEDQVTIGSEANPIVIRYKGFVPMLVKIPHIAAMFFALLFTLHAGILILQKNEAFYRDIKVATILTFFGGLLMGPWVQLYAFDEWWAGVPFGWDLTDNKTLIMFMALAAAWWFNRKEKSFRMTLIAVIVTFGVFVIPHSMFGSELDHSTGKIHQANLIQMVQPNRS